MPYYFWALHLAPTVGKKSIFFLALLKKSWKITHLYIPEPPPVINDSEADNQISQRKIARPE